MDRTASPHRTCGGLLEPDARKRARPGSEGGRAQQCARPTRPEGAAGARAETLALNGRRAVFEVGRALGLASAIAGRRMRRRRRRAGLSMGETCRSSTRPTTIQWSPAGCSATISHSRVARASVSSGTPPSPSCPVEAGEAVRAGRGRASCEVLVLPSQHVDAEAPRAPHPRPGERAARRAERHQRRLERDGRERVDDQPGGLAVRRRRDEGDAGREPAERVAERARVRRRRGGGWSGERHLSAATPLRRARRGRGSRTRGWRRAGA